MKNKITKLFLAVLAIALGGNVQAQDQTMPDYVRNATNFEYLRKFAEEKAVEYEINYKKAVEIARAQNKPISGEKDGRVFALAGYDKETGGLIYNTTYNKVINENKMFFNNVAVGSSLQTANAKPLHADGISGVGMIVGVWDGGAGLPTHLAFATGRYQLKNSPNTNSSALGRSHAAHVAGTVAAGEFGSNTEVKGFAYSATVHAYNGINAYDITPMSAAATATVNPIFISNHSYGLDFGGSGLPVSVFGQYNSRAREYDELANNAPYYTIVFAAGNDRTDGFNPSKISGKDLLSQGGVSKNTVVVAATRGTENFSGITGPSSVSSVGGIGPFISSYSNFGPTDDFRIKPDIAAKGGEASANDLVHSVGNSGIAATADMQGTSMAAPAVTGVFTLWQGYHKEVFDRYMLSSSVRALMAHSAREAGPSPGPDFMFGWGLIDADKGRQIIDQAEAGTALFRELELPQGAIFEYGFTYDGVAPLIATIAWNDPAGTVTSQTDLNVKKIVNDLDLRLINTDTNITYYPWSLPHLWSTSPTAGTIAVRNVDNARDNIEKIEPQSAVAGNYKIVVNHKGSLQAGKKQDYTLIISGAGGQMPPTDGKASVEDIAFSTLKIYPNPVSSILNINGNLQELDGAEAKIYDINGKNIKDFTLNFSTNNVTVDVSSLQSGVYILSLSKNGSKKSYKFIKK